MWHVYQEDAKGCGLAALAMVLGRSYAQVRVIAQRHGWWNVRSGMRARDVESCAKMFGATVVRQRRPPGDRPLLFPAVVNVRWSTRRHWVVVRPNGWVHDPAGRAHMTLGDYLRERPGAAVGTWYVVDGHGDPR